MEIKSIFGGRISLGLGYPSDWAVVGLVECVPSTRKLQVYSPALHNTGVIVHVCNIGTEIVDTGRSEVQDPPQLYRESEASLEYMKPYQRKG